MTQTSMRLPQNSNWAQRQSDFALVAVVGVTVLLVLMAILSAAPGLDHPRRATARSFRQIRLALKQYHADYGSFPPAFTTDTEGRKLHSWRTLILPYIGQKALYDKIDLTKSWIDPVNSAAYFTPVPTYQSPEHMVTENDSHYLMIVGNGCFMPPTGVRRLSEITDPASETLMLVEVNRYLSVPWMSPQDADEDLIYGIGHKGPLVAGAHVAFVDGSMAFFQYGTREADRRAMLSINGKDRVSRESD